MEKSITDKIKKTMIKEKLPQSLFLLSEGGGAETKLNLIIVKANMAMMILLSIVFLLIGLLIGLHF